MKLSSILVSDMDFQPPPHWVATPTIRGRGLWVNPDDHERGRCSYPGSPDIVDQYYESCSHSGGESPNSYSACSIANAIEA